jgi:gas vesicle structural protein
MGGFVGVVVERSSSSTSFIEVLDRVLDKGIVIDAQARVSVAGIDLMSIDGWVVIASIQTYLKYADSLGISAHLPGARESNESLFPVSRYFSGS